MKVYTFTPNPALDVSGTVDCLAPNEKNYVHNMRRDPGGNGINSARVLTRLIHSGQLQKELSRQLSDASTDSTFDPNVSALALGFIGGSTGEEILSALKNEKVPNQFIQIKNQTRTNITVTETLAHKQTRLAFPGPLLLESEKKAWFKKIGTLPKPARKKTQGLPDLLIVSGSLPEGFNNKSGPDFYKKTILIAQKMGLKVIVDVPSRTLACLTKPTPKAPPHPWLLIKPNEHELEEWVGHKLDTQKKLDLAAKKLLRWSEAVCVSLGEKGANLYTRSGLIYRGSPLQIHAKGTVGAGDSMIAGMAFVLASSNSQKKWEVALKLGMACGAATASALGTAQAEPEAILRFFKQVYLSKNIEKPL